MLFFSALQSQAIHRQQWLDHEAVLNFPPAAKLPTNKFCQSQNLS
jgi:hypothetical protein